MISTLFMVVQAFKKNVTKEMAHMSGGEYNTFTGDKGFEKRVVESAQHARNRYLITFSPSDPDAGPAYDSGAPGAGLRRARCGAGELLEGAGAVEAASRRTRSLTVYSGSPIAVSRNHFSQVDSSLRKSHLC